MGQSTLPRAESSWILTSMPVADRSIAAAVFATPLRGGSRVSLPCVRANARGSATSRSAATVLRSSMAIRSMSSLSRPSGRCVRARAVPPMKWIRSLMFWLRNAEQMRDEMVALDLFGCDAELLRDFGALVSVHAKRPMIQRGAATP